MSISPDVLDRILPQVAKPARYAGREWNSALKDWKRIRTKIALAYPDIYEVGMSNLGLAILYDLLNKEEDILAERVYAPWVDMEKALRTSRAPLYSLETKHPLSDFDILGFSLGYELNYTNVLTILDLASIPLLAKDREEEHPLIIAGGTCAYNPEPMADFFDLFVIGEGEEVLLQLVRAYGGRRGSKKEFLLSAAQMDGIYVPGLYRVDYQRGASPLPLVPEAKPVITKRMVGHLPPPPTRMVVPYAEVVHDRGMIEIQRGCTRGCRFCQAGMIYRPVRERSLEEVLGAADELLHATGYEEIALLSLSSCDHSRIKEMVGCLLERHPRTIISLPSLRIDSFSLEMAALFQGKRKTGLTLAPEAGSQRLRDVINKGITEEAILSTVEAAFRGGWQRIKLYFMKGLPTETEQDILGIARLVRAIRDMARRFHGGRGQVSASVATFIPKPHTPFQWAPLARDLESRQALLQKELRQPGIHLSWDDPRTSRLEATLSMGDRRLARVILKAWQKGARMDAWSENLDHRLWWEAFRDENLESLLSAQYPPDLNTPLPWDHIDTGVRKQFLLEEYGRAMRAELTPDCRVGSCLGCGITDTFRQGAKAGRPDGWGCPAAKANE